MTDAGYSSQREADTLAKCDAILAALTHLKSLIKAGPRLTVAEEARISVAIPVIRFPYADLADHCRHNLKGG